MIPRASGLMRVWGPVWSPSRNALLKWRVSRRSVVAGSNRGRYSPQCATALAGNPSRLSQHSCSLDHLVGLRLEGQRNAYSERPCRFYIDRQGRAIDSVHREIVRLRTGQDRQVPPPHSMTSSARARSVGGIDTLSALAVLRLITSLKRSACSTGRSAGLAPFNILST